MLQHKMHGFTMLIIALCYFCYETSMADEQESLKKVFVLVRYLQNKIYLCLYNLICAAAFLQLVN